jgi:hypothetical protein
MTTNIERDDKLEKKFVDKLPEDWRTRVQAMSNEELKALVIEVANNENENQKKKEEDIELQDAKEAYAAAGAEYKEATSLNKLRIKYVLRELNRNGAV